MLRAAALLLGVLTRIETISCERFQPNSACTLEAAATEEIQLLTALPGPEALFQTSPLTPKNATTAASDVFWRNIHALSTSRQTAPALHLLDLRLSHTTNSSSKKRRRQTAAAEETERFEIYFAAFWIGIKHESLHGSELESSPFTIGRAQVCEEEEGSCHPLN